MKAIDRYPELSNYVKELAGLVKSLTDTTLLVDRSTVNNVATLATKVNVESVIKMANREFSPQAEVDTLLQAERALTTCKILENAYLLPTSSISRWRNIGIRAESK